MAGDNSELYHEILMPDGKRFRVKKEDWDAKTDKYIHKLSAGKIRMTDGKGNNSYVSVSEYNDAVKNRNMHALRIGWTMNEDEATLSRSSYKDVYKPAKVAAQPKAQQASQSQQPKGQQVSTPKATQAAATQQRPAAQAQGQPRQAQQAQRQQPIQQPIQPTQQPIQQAIQPTQQAAQVKPVAQRKASGSSEVLRTAKLRRGGKDYEIPWQEINAEGGIEKYIANHDSKEAPIRVYMRDASGKLFHTDVRTAIKHRHSGKGYKFAVGQTKRWRPTEQEKAANMADIQEMADNTKDIIGGYQQSMRRAAGLPEGDFKPGQATAAREQERNRRKDAEFVARLHGLDTKPMGLFSGGGLSPDGDSEKKVSQQEQSPFAVANAESPEVNRVVMVDGKPTVEWVLPDGTLTTDRMEADKVEYYARRERGRRAGEEELRKMGINPFNPFAVQQQRAWKNLANDWGEKQAAQIREMLGNSNATKQAWEITDQLYKEADGEMNAARKRNAERSNVAATDFGGLGGKEMHISNFGVFAGRNFADYLDIYDLMDMSDKVWGMMDEDKKNDLRKTAKEMGYTSAEDIEKYARQKSDEVVWGYAKMRHAPKNVLDLFVRNVINANTVTSVAKGLMRIGTKKQGDLDAREMAYAEYGKEHPGWSVAGSVVGVTSDPLTWASGWVGGKAGKFALSLYGRRLEKMYQLAKGAGKGLAAAKGSGKLLAGIAGGAGNFATFEAGGDIKMQIEKGGVVGDDGRVHGYSVGSVVGSAVKGAGMGAVMGAGSHFISKGASKAIAKTEDAWGQIGISAAKGTVDTLWSASILTVPEWFSGEIDGFDAWWGNVQTMAGFKAHHGIKAAPSVIRELTPYKHPVSQAERMHNRKSFVEHVQNIINKGNVNTWITLGDKEELARWGYQDFYDLFRARDKDGILDTKTKYSTKPWTQEYKDAFVRMEEFVQDERVSQRLRSKMYSMLTGRALPVSGFIRADWGETEDGSGYVATFSPDGKLVTFDLYKDDVQAAGAADKLSETCQRVAVGYAEDFANGVADNELLIESLIRVYAKRNPEETRMDEELVRFLVDEYRAMIAKPKDELTAEERVYLDMMNSEIIANHRKQERRRPEGARELIRDNYGVDVDAALRKGYFKQTEREQKAIEEYVRLLMPKEEEFNRMYDGDFSHYNASYVDADNPDKPNDPDDGNGGGEPPVEATDANVRNEGNDSDVRNVGNDSDVRNVENAGGVESVGGVENGGGDGVSPMDSQPERANAARMQAAAAEYDAALDELSRVVGEEYVNKIVNEIGAKEYLDYLKGEGITSGAEFDAVSRLIAADEAVDQANRDVERDLGYQSGLKAAEQMTDEELAAELTKAGNEANDTMPNEYNIGYIDAISDTLRDRQKKAVEEKELPTENEPNRPNGANEANEGNEDLPPVEDGAQVSDETNEFGKPFILSSDGTTTFGSIQEDSGLKAAPIKLSLGENFVDENGKNHGYGLLHIEAGHGKQIKDAGFSTIEEFVEMVAKNYDTIREGGIIANNQTYLLEISDKHNNTLFIQLSRDGNYWNINSAGIFKTKYSRRKPEVFTRPALKTETNTDSSGVNSGQLSGVTAPAGNSPQTSDGKGSESFSKKQGIAGNGSALSRVPVDGNGEPQFESVDSATGWDALVEMMGGNEDNAMAIAQAQADQAGKAVEAIKKREPQKGKVKLTGSVSEMANAVKEADAKYAEEHAAWQSEMAAAVEKHERWQALAGEREARRKAEEEAAAEAAAEEERRRKEEEEAKRKEEEEERNRKAAELAAAAAQQAAAAGAPEDWNTWPNWTAEPAADGRKRGGFRRNGAALVKRQGEVEGVPGNATSSKFATDVIVPGQYMVIEADDIQPSHIQGQANPLHFITEAQPKDRKDEVSVMSAQKIAVKIRPEEITSAVTAYTGVPTVNARGEVIQGNNRADALKILGDYAESARRYKQYLIDHAAEFGIDPEAVAKMKNPVLVNRLEVSDADAIRLGQYTQKDIESGGFERIEPGTTLTKMGDKVQSFTNILFQGSADQDMSISELISANGHEALRWLLDHGCISDNQYTSALNAKGDLTADAKLDIRNIMAANLFKGASPVLKEKFGELPAAAQKALLETVYRDMYSESDRKIMPEIHKSIEAFSELMKMPAFKDARNVEMAVKALQDYVRQFAFDEVTGETVSPSDKFSNFALHLAALYKGSTQRDLRALFNRFYDNVQGKVEASLFEEADTEMKTVADAVKTVFGIDYKPLKAKEDGNGSNGTGTLGVDNNGGPSRERDGGNDAEGGKLVSQGNGDADNTGGNGSDSGQGKGSEVTDSGGKPAGGGKTQVRRIVEENGGGDVKEQKVVSGDGKKVANSAEEQALVEGLVGVMRKAGIVVHTDVEAGQKRLDSADGADVRQQAKKKRALETASLADTARSLTVVSSADGAKILNNLDNLAQTFEKNKTQPKTFIGDVASALGAERKGSGSQYATFETKNDRVITIRLSNHNARVSTFDYNGEFDGISIVVSPKANIRLTNDGNAHTAEYYYDAIALRRAEGKPLADIVRSIKQALYSGEFKDTTGLAERQEVNIPGDMKFFRRGDGEVYGYTVGGEIYLDPRVATAETPIHEYGHLWAAFLRKVNPKGWGDVVKLMKECTDLWDQVTRDYPELKAEDDIAEEVLMHYSGRRGAERLRAEMQKAMESAGKDMKKQTAIASMFEGVRRALSRFWRGVADLFHIRFTSAEDVADRMLADMLNGFNPTEAGKKVGAKMEDGKPRYQIIGEKGAESLDKAEEATARLDNLGVAREMESAGKDAKAIRLATGWERGADGKWRYEVPDGKFDSKGGLNPERRKLSAEEQKEYESLFFEALRSKAWEKGVEKYGELRDDTDMAEVYMLGGMSPDHAKRYVELDSRHRELGNSVKHLDDYLDNKELFDAYPELKDVKVVASNDNAVFAGEMASYNPETNTITLHDNAHDTLIHEVQHAIQYIEGFAKGGYSGMFDGSEGSGSSETSYNKYRRLGGEVEARNVQERMYMSEEERRNTLLSETEDVAREDQIFLQDSLGENQMGSHVDNRMSEIGEYYSGRELSDNERSIADVYSGKADNKTVTVMRDGKAHKVVMRKGNELKAGTRHSLYRHYGTNVGVITKDDILLIPEVIEKGEMQNKGSRRVYKIEQNGVNYTVVTEKKHNREEFCDFYSNRKSDQTRTLNTQLSARGIQPGHQDAAKLAKESENSNTGGKNYLEDTDAGVAEVKDSFERYRGRNPQARQMSLFGDDSKAQPEARQLSLFDDAEVDGSGRIIEPERQVEMDRDAEKVNSSLDEFTDEYADYLRLLDEMEGSEDFMPEEAENHVMNLRDRLVEDLMEYHRSAGMGEAEARKRSWELVNQTMTDINIALLRKGKGGNIEKLPEENVKVKRMNESEEAKEWLPELGEGEFCYMERKFSEDKSFVFSAPEHIESMDDVAYIFKQLEKYSVEHSFLALVKDGKVTVVHLGMGNAAGVVVNTAAARAALDKFDPDYVYFVHNHPSGSLKSSEPDKHSLRTILEITKGKVECEALIIDTLSGKYAQFGLGGDKQILDLPKGYDIEVEVKVQAHDKMEYDPDYTPDKKQQIKSSRDVAKYISSLRVGSGDKVGALVLDRTNGVIANLYLPMSEDMLELGDDIAGKAVRFGGSGVIIYTNNGQMLEVGKVLEDAVKGRSGGSVRLLDVLSFDKDGGYEARSESVFEAEGEYGGNVRYNMGDGAETFVDRQRRAVENKGTVMPGLNSAVVKVVDVPRHSYTGNIAEATQQAIEAAKAKYAPNGEPKVLHYDNFGTKFDYTISGRAIKESLNPIQQGKSVNKGVHLSVIEHIDKIINNSIEVEEHPDYTKNSHGVRDGKNVNNDVLMHRFYGTIRIEGKDYYVMTLMREDVNAGNGAYAYEVQKIKVLNDDTSSTSNGSHGLNSGLEARGIKGLDMPNAYPVANLIKDVDKSYDSGKKILAESRKADSFESTSTNPVDMQSEAERLSAELGTPVRIVADASEAASLPTVRQRRAKGFWSEKDGVVIILSNHKDTGDVANTVLHEIVGHDGLRVLFPEKEKLDNALDELYGVSEDKIRANIDSRTEKIYNNEVDRIMERKRHEHAAKGENPAALYLKDLAEAHAEAQKKRAEMRREATEEYGADLAGRIGEDGFKRMDAEEGKFWGKLKVMLQKAFDNLLRGLRIKRGKKWTDKEWAFVMHEAWKRKRNGGKPSIKDMADTEAMRNRTGFNQTERGKEKDADERFRDGDEGLDEAITRMKVEEAAKNVGNLEKRNEAVKAIGGNLTKLHKAMAKQREYDTETVKSITDLATTLMKNGMMDNVSQYEIKRIMSAVKGSVGKQDTSKQVQQIMDIMVDNQLKNTSKMLEDLIKEKGTKVNHKGLEVQGTLDPDGQMLAKMIRQSIQMPEEWIKQKASEAVDEIGSENPIISNDAAIQYEALLFAGQYNEFVTKSKADELTLRESLKDAKKRLDSGEVTKEEYRQFAKAVEESIRENKIARAENMRTLCDTLYANYADSINKAAQWAESVKAKVKEIHHLANSDMQGRELKGHKKDGRLQKFNNSWLVRAALEPLATFDQMLKMFGSHHSNGQGYLQDYFMRSWIDSADKEQLLKEKYHDLIDEKAAEIFGKRRTIKTAGLVEVPYRFVNLYDYAETKPSLKLTYYDGAARREYELSQGVMLYLYAVDKMPMGKATNRRMGFTDEVMDKIVETLDPKLMEYADWVQEELLPGLRIDVDEVYQNVFGAHMDKIENYFPFVRDKNALKKEVQNGETENPNDKIGVMSGGAFKKRVTSTSIWAMNDVNFFDVLAKHITEVIHDSSYAELNRDLGTLLSYNRFHQQVLNMNSAYGSGEKLWKRFKEVCAIATDNYEPKRSKYDAFLVTAAKGIAMSKITYRSMTAAKQVLSLPAFFGEVNLVYLAEDLATGGILALQWSWKNMPNFRKRILSRTTGEYRLKETEYEGKILQSLGEIGKIGMFPNIGVDAWTIAIGAHCHYLTQRDKYLRWGMDEEKAHRRAVQDAELCFNKSQQSSEGAFMAPIQIDHTWSGVGAMLFRTASTSYTRETHNSARNLKRILDGEVTAEFMAKQWLRLMEVKTFSQRFDEELGQQVNGMLPQGHIYQLGKPGGILQSAGFPDMPIELSAKILAEKSNMTRHPFPIAVVKGLVEAINKPIAVFRYGNNAMNVIVGLNYGGKQFVIGVHFNKTYRGAEVSDIRGIFPKDNAEWLNWISKELMTYLDHQKIQALIDQQRMTLAEVEYLDLDDVAKIMNEFENPNIPDQKINNEYSDEDYALAMKVAKKEIRHDAVKNGANVAIYGWLLPWLWRIGGIAPMLLLSSDEREKKKMLKEETLTSALGPLEGITYGDVITDAIAVGAGFKERKWSNIGRSNPLIEDVHNVLESLDKENGGWLQACNQVINILVATAIGVSPQTITDAVVAIMDASDDPKTQRETALLIARIMNCPPSQLEKIYFDEINATGLEARQMTPQEVAQRYADYKIMREAPMTGWMYDAEDRKALQGKYEKKSLSKDKEKIQENTTAAAGKKDYDRVMKDYEQLQARVKDIGKLRDEPGYAYEAQRMQFDYSPEGRKYKVIRQFKKDLNELTEQYLKAKNPDEMRQIGKAIEHTKKQMLSDVQEIEEKAADKKMRELRSAAHN